MSIAALQRPKDRFGVKAPFKAPHHIALVTNDMEKTVSFYRDILGAEVAMTHRVPRLERERHYFITIAENTVLAFFEFPDADLPPFIPATKRKTGRALDHIAFFVEDRKTLDAWHEYLTEKVDNVTEIRDLGLAHAFFFSDPNGIVIEVMAEQEGKMRFPQYYDDDPVLDLPRAIEESSGGGEES